MQNLVENMSAEVRKQLAANIQEHKISRAAICFLPSSQSKPFYPWRILNVCRNRSKRTSRFNRLFSLTSSGWLFLKEIKDMCQAASKHNQTELHCQWANFALNPFRRLSDSQANFPGPPVDFSELISSFPTRLPCLTFSAEPCGAWEQICWNDDRTVVWSTEAMTTMSAKHEDQWSWDACISASKLKRNIRQSSESSRIWQNLCNIRLLFVWP